MNEFYDMLWRGLITVRKVSILEAKFGRLVEKLEACDFGVN